MRLEPGLSLLTGGPRDVPARLRTMRDAINWSHHLLDPAEQVLFRRLAIFDGGFRLEAAEAVVNVALDPPTDVLEGMRALVEKSLQLREDGPDGEPWYGFLEMIREYAWEQLQESGEVEAILHAHLEHYLAVAERAAPGLRAGQHLPLLEREQANLRVALASAVERPDGLGLRLAGSVWWFWYMHGQVREGQAWLERALADGADAPSAARAEALLGFSTFAWVQGDASRAEAAAEEALRLNRRLDDSWGTAYALNLLGQFAADRGDAERAVAAAEQAVAIFRAADAPTQTASALNNLGSRLQLRGDITRADGCFEEALTLYRALGNPWRMALPLGSLGDLARLRGDDERATVCYREALSLSSAHDDRWRIAQYLDRLAGLSAAGGQAERAARLFGAAEAIYDELGIPRPSLAGPTYRYPPRLAQYLGDVGTVRAALEDTTFAAAWAAGRSLTIDEAVAEALALDQPTKDLVASTDPAARHSLTPREWDVLRVVVEGKSDKEIASASSVRYRTITNHVASILAKLGVESRTAAATYAVRQGFADGTDV